MSNRTRSILVGLKALSSCKMHPWTRSWSIRIAASMRLLVLTDRYKIWTITLRLLCQPSAYRTWQDHRPQYLCTVNTACFNPLVQHDTNKCWCSFVLSFLLRSLSELLCSYNDEDIYLFDASHRYVHTCTHSSCMPHASIHSHGMEHLHRTWIAHVQHMHITCKHAHMHMHITCKHAHSTCKQHMQTCTQHMHITCKHAHHRCVQWCSCTDECYHSITQFTHTHIHHTQATHRITHINSNSPCFLPRAALAVTSSSGIKGTETALQVLHKTQQSVVFISGTSLPLSAKVDINIIHG